MRAAVLGLGIAVTMACGSARAEEPGSPPPPTGTPWIVAGSLIAAGGVVDLALAPGCALTHVAPSQQVTCAVTAVVSGAALVAIGTPLLGVGLLKRGAWLEHLRAAPAPTGLVVGWGGRF